MKHPRIKIFTMENGIQVSTSENGTEVAYILKAEQLTQVKTILK